MTESLVDTPRIENLTRFVKLAPHGAVLEVGVYRGGSLMAIACATREKVYGIDTFSGLPEKTMGIDTHHIGDFDSTSFEEVLSLFLPYQHVAVLKGFFPRDFTTLEVGSIGLAHIDVDMYKSTKDCLSYVHDRVVTGGYILCDDYAAQTTPGAKLAVHEFLGEHAGSYIIESIVQCQITLRRT